MVSCFVLCFNFVCYRLFGLILLFCFVTVSVLWGLFIVYSACVYFDFMVDVLRVVDFC